MLKIVDDGALHFVQCTRRADLQEMTDSMDNDRHPTPDSQYLRYWRRYLGAQSNSDKVLDELSPVQHIDNVTIPILLIHGDNDPVVPLKQSQLMANALKKAGKPYEFVKLKGEDHWLSRTETRVQMLQATVKFLETNNPPK
jgi:dipeptidyl aminopeptidase/acylaminoacyl peptidase